MPCRPVPRPARISFELNRACHHARASHSPPTSAHVQKKPTHNSRSLTLLTSLPTGLDLALGEKVKNMDLIDLSVVGHPPFLVRVLIGLSAVTLPPMLPPYNPHHSTTSSTLLLPPLPPRCRSTSSASRKAARRLDYVAVEAHLHARGLADEGRRQGRRRNPHPNPIPARPRPLLPPRRCAPRKGVGGVDLPLSAPPRARTGACHMPCPPGSRSFVAGTNSNRRGRALLPSPRPCARSARRLPLAPCPTPPIQSPAEGPCT